jgi:hypothetical protein
MAQRKAASHGVELDIGTIPTYPGMDPLENDPERPARILAHALARTADRFPLLRKISRQVEGTDAKAGLGADLVASVYELCVRNQEQLEELLKGYMSNAERRRMEKAVNGTTRSRFGRKSHNQEVPQ